MASALRPAYSRQVCQIIQPSLVWIESEAEFDPHARAGGGVIVSGFGDILTSLHVVADSPRIRVTFADGTQSNAVIATAQPEKDIAVLQAETLPELFLPATLGNPGALQVGDEAYVVGNPFGLWLDEAWGDLVNHLRRGYRSDHRGLIEVDRR
jgi:S1-C subfamily serine protease